MACSYNVFSFLVLFVFFFKQKTAYEMRISDWSSDVCSSDLMNAEALTRTIATGEAHYWSRSRKVLWHKGATSGLVQKVVELRIDDDQDAVWLRVKIPGDASCHVGYRSCFYRSVPTGQPADQPVALKFEENAMAFDPKAVYGEEQKPTLDRKRTRLHSRH